MATLAMFDLSSPNTLNLVQPKFFLFGKELTLSQASPGFQVSAVQVF